MILFWSSSSLHLKQQTSPGSFRIFHEHKSLQKPQPLPTFLLSASSRRVHHSVLPRRVWRHHLQAKFGKKNIYTEKTHDFNATYHFAIWRLFTSLFTGYLEVSGSWYRSLWKSKLGPKRNFGPVARAQLSRQVWKVVLVAKSCRISPWSRLKKLMP